MIKNRGFLGHFLRFLRFFQFRLNISASNYQNLIWHEIFDLLTPLTPLGARPQRLKRKLTALDTVIRPPRLLNCQNLPPGLGLTKEHVSLLET